MTQAICEYRAAQGIDGPLYLGMDTHAVSPAAQRTALEVLAAHGVDVFLQRDDGFTPTPVVSHAILTYNRGANGRARRRHRRDAVAQPARDGGFKYNPPHGGPADVDVTRVDPGAGERAARVGRARGPARPVRAGARARATTHAHDFVAAVRRRPRLGGRPGRDPLGRHPDRGGSARRRERRVLGADRRALRASTSRS